MSLPGFDELMSDADARQPRVPVVAAGGSDPTVLEALSQAASRGWVRPFLTGLPERIRDVASQAHIDLSLFQVVADTDDSAVEAVRLVREGTCKLLMKGQLPTPSLMKAILDRELGLRTGQTICQVVLMEILRDQRRFLLADTGVTIQPTLEQKRQIAQLSADTARRLGCISPRIALMAASEKVVEQMPETLHARDLVAEQSEGIFGESLVQGPLSFDLAYSSDASHKKQFQGEVTGAADVMIFPDLLSANLTVKGIMYTADCRFGGVLRGAACPVVFMSRADTSPTRLNSLAYALRLVAETN